MAAKVLTAAQFKAFIEAIGDLVRSIDTLVHDLRENKGLPMPAADPTPPPPAAPKAPVAKSAAALSYEELKDVVLRLAETKGQLAATTIFKEFGVTHAKQIPEERYGEALKAFQDALATPALA